MTRTRRRIGGTLLLLLLGLAGCAGQPLRPGAGYSDSPTGTAERAGETSPVVAVVNVVTTPLFLALKLVVCGATLAVAVPGLALSGVSDPDGWQRQRIEDGLAANCGPPYTLY